MSIIWLYHGLFASFSSAPPESFHPGVSGVGSGALLYSETRISWMLALAVLLWELRQLFHSSCTEISGPVHPIWRSMQEGRSVPVGSPLGGPVVGKKEEAAKSD